MKKVYLIRHGLPDFPGGKGMCIGTTDVPMGEKFKKHWQQMLAMTKPSHCWKRG